MAAELELDHITKTFATPQGPLTVLADIDLTITPRSFVSLVGASGCGKSTLLNILAGLDTPTMGVVRQRGVPITGPGPERGMVFQSYTLFPWLTVAQTVAFGLSLRGLGRREISTRVGAYLEIVGLTSAQDRYPDQLSGGMQQRVALARALINEPQVLLLDEPFAALDSQTRGLMQEFLAQLWQRQPVTVVLVTHDVGEAIYLGEQIYVLASRPGRVAHRVTVDLPQLRTYEIRKEPAFIQTQAQVLDWLRVEAMKSPP